MRLSIPDFSLVVLIGPSGSGKSTFARRCFRPTEVVSSDACRALVADDETDQAATPAAFEVLRLIVAKRLEARRLTVIDATNVRAEDRAGPGRAGAERTTPSPSRSCSTSPRRSARRATAAAPTAQFGPHVVRNQAAALRRSLKGLGREGFRFVHRLSSAKRRKRPRSSAGRCGPTGAPRPGPSTSSATSTAATTSWCGCCGDLGYAVEDGPRAPSPCRRPGAKRSSSATWSTAARGARGAAPRHGAWSRPAHALCVPGNHEAKLLRALKGGNVKPTHGLAETLAQLEAEPPEFARKAAAFIDGLVSHYVLDGGRLVVAHAGMKEAMQGRASGAVRAFALYGETSGESDEFGLPVRHDWARGLPRHGSRSSTATRPCRRRAGSTARSASTPAASSAAG